MNKYVRNTYKHILKPLLTTVTVLVTLLLLVVLYGGFNVLVWTQSDNQVHLDYKQSYLRQLATRTPLENPPNIVFILYDDLGYGDIGPGSTDQIATPHIDQLAANGVSLSQFYSPASACTPSRAGYLSARLAPRAGLPAVVFTPHHPMNYFAKAFGNRNLRLPAEEILIPEVLAAVGYRTGMVGKWNLGDHSPSLPNDFGFQQFFGGLYANDMKPFALYRDGEIEVEAPVDQSQLNNSYTREATQFIKSGGDQPFFLYLAHTSPHIPLSVHSDQVGRSRAGLYGDVVEDLDDGIGSIVRALEETGQLDNTLIIISSDNGPWFQGSIGGLRGRKGDTFEGGMRVPFIAHWPARLPRGVVRDQISMGIDLLPTIADWLGLPLPTDRIIDGLSVAQMLESGSPGPHEYLHYYAGEELLAVRDQRFKYRPRYGIAYGAANMPIWVGIPRGPWLFNLADDMSESFDVSTVYGADMTRLSNEFERKKNEMTVNKRGWLPTGN